jgi:hypothetical protein
MPITTNVHVIVDASPNGIESVRIRAPQGHRAAGPQFLDQLLQPLKALNRARRSGGVTIPTAPRCSLGSPPSRRSFLAVTQSVAEPGEARAHHNPGLILDFTIDF